MMTRMATRTGQGRSPASDDKGFDEIVVRINRCAAVVRGGRRFSFGALVVVGDRNGKVGVGYGKSKEVPSAVEKGRKAATQNMKPIKIVAGTLPHRVVGRFGASHVVMVPAGPGTGVIAGGSVRAVLELAGVRNVLTKSFGSNSPQNLVNATLNGLLGMLTREDIEELRGRKLPA